MRPLSESTARVAAKSFQRKYIALGRIVKSWPAIIGEKMADKAHPAQIRYRKKRKKTDPTQTVLDIAVNNADATLLHYQKNLILERINNIFGENWIADIRFVPMVHNDRPHKQKTTQKSFRTLTEDENTALSGMIAEIEDEDLKNRLNALGQKVMTKDT